MILQRFHNYLHRFQNFQKILQKIRKNFKDFRKACAFKRDQTLEIELNVRNLQKQSDSTLNIKLPGTNLFIFD